MMGCSYGKSPHREPLFNSSEFKADLKVLARLKLNIKDVCILYEVFDKILSGDMKTISQTELLDFSGLPSTPFTRELLSILNPNKSGELDFRGFVVCLWNVCTLTRDNMDLFLFDLNDKWDQPLSPADVQAMFYEIYGEDEINFDPHAQSLVADLNILGKRKKTFNKERFRVFMMQHQAVLRPVFQIQRLLQHKICGGTFWDEQTQKRKALCPDSYISVAQVLDPVKSGLHCEQPRSARKKRASPDYVSWKRKVSMDKVFVDAHAGGMILHDLPDLSAASRRNNSFHELLNNSTKRESPNGARSGGYFSSLGAVGSDSGSGSGRGNKKDRGIATAGQQESTSSPAVGGLFGNYESPSRRHRKSVVAGTVAAPLSKVTPKSPGKVTFKTTQHGDIDMEEME